jgi:hypothetical protein
MADVPEEEVDSWIDAISRLYGGGRWDPGDWQRASHAVAMLWSEFGFLDAPIEILHMFKNAIEVGYMTALQDVRNGDFDDEIRMWRPDLSGE